ncbi:hypothetical protein JQ621_03810 [Bradyrhizobium manausense]|uniref:hypothetical protein n=1 Tax=Bradyrhizobium manausense TaxID=989370 RepID=UPI001BAB3D88|nr:hypothetical protein [Bradyrhizobium manausense]MBR1086595.1 hypothetical protein [Bradyrhizobium manausense]
MADWGWNLIYVTGAAIVAFLTASRLRKQHASELYLIWYINSLFFLLFLALEIVAAKNNARLHAVCTPYEATCAAVVDYLTNAKNELILIGAIVGVFIGPQLLTYLLAGISGAAIAPKFVWHIEQFVVWSLIKFIAALAGIRSATPFAKLLTHQAVEIVEFLPGLILIATAFGWAGVHFDLHAQRDAVSRQLVGPKPSWPIRQAVRLHNYFTRNAREG